MTEELHPWDNGRDTPYEHRRGLAFRCTDGPPETHAAVMGGGRVWFGITSYTPAEARMLAVDMDADGFDLIATSLREKADKVDAGAPDEFTPGTPGVYRTCDMPCCKDWLDGEDEEDGGAEWAGPQAAFPGDSD